MSGSHRRALRTMMPLESYVMALEQAGLAITSRREPAAKPVAGPDKMERWTR